ncbi:MAG: hypothetical protein JRI59_09650 [Deltaproteobacteria bacterium]|nr:hypothetical protein [Deltaproteobacteria bacterium]
MGVIVRQKVKGKGKPWWVFVAHNGKRKSIKVGDRQAAEALARKIQEKLAAGALGIGEEKRIPTFGEYARKWLATYGETHLKYSTLKRYESLLRFHLTGLDSLPLDQVTRPGLKDLLYDKLKAGLAPTTVIRIKALIKEVHNGVAC